jgi:hypothetical protein
MGRWEAAGGLDAHQADILAIGSVVSEVSRSRASIPGVDRL